MYYIYTLSLFGRVFYIGCTRQPIIRYKQHYHDPSSSCYKLVRYWLHKSNEPMQMNIYDTVGDRVKALQFEYKLIKHLGGWHPLLNNEFSPNIFTSVIPQIKRLRTKKLIEGELIKVKTQIDEGKKI